VNAAEYGVRPARVLAAGYDYFSMDVLTAVAMHSISFGRTAIGLVIRPYETYRRIVDRGRVGELYALAGLLVAYFVLASVVKVATFRSFLLTRQFVVLSLAALVGYGVSVGTLWLAGIVVKAKVRFATLAVAWGYTLLPTVAWFFATSLLYVILPPPRTTSIMGILFSALFLVFSVTLLWWKVMLSYLTIRFTLKLDLPRIAAVCAIVLPVVGVYSALMYSWGIFKVPFL